MSPRITIWVTEHTISQRVAAALVTGLKDCAAAAVASTITPAMIAATDVHIGYGILRGMDNVFMEAEKQKKHWFELDLGYFEPAHFHGNYRVSYHGTQAMFDEQVQAEHGADCTPWKTGGTYALLCPPTEFVCAFFKLNEAEWIEHAQAQAAQLGLPPKLRRKGDTEDLDVALSEAACVITFNSSVGWRALQKGIPAISDVTRSTVGSWQGADAQKSLDGLRACSREALFRFMRASQLSLLDIQKGLIKDQLRRFVQDI